MSSVVPKSRRLILPSWGVCGAATRAEGSRKGFNRRRPSAAALARTTMARPFTIYMRLWCIVNLLRISIGLNAGTGLVGSTLDKGALFLPLIVLAAGVFPSRCSGAIPFAAMLVRALTNIYKGAFMSNSQMWATQMDAALMLALAMQWFTSARKKSGFVYSLTADDERGII